MASLRQTASKFVKESKGYPLSGMGNLNTYRLFSELSTRIIKFIGSSGLIIQTGMATDSTGKEFFTEQLSKGRLIRFLDFENRGNFLPMYMPSSGSQ